MWLRFYAVMLLLFFLTVCVPENAHAYIDPGTGSYILQIIIGVLLGALFAVKLAWRKIIVFLKAIYSKVKR